MAELSKALFQGEPASARAGKAPSRRCSRLLAGWKLSCIAQLSDFAAVNSAALAGYMIADGTGGSIPLRYSLVFIGTSLLCQISFMQGHLYSIRELSDPVRAMKAMVPRWSFIFLMLAATAALTHEPALFSRLWFGLFYVGGVSLLFLGRLLIARAIRSLIAAGFYTSRVVIVGDNEVSAALIALVSTSAAGVHFDAVFNDGDSAGIGFIGGVPKRGGVDELIAHAKTHQVDLVIVTLPIVESGRITKLLRRLQNEPLTIRVLPGSLGMQRISPIRLTRDELPGVQLIPLADRPISGVAFFAKGLFDRTTALCALVIFTPVLLLCALAIMLSDPGPVFFVQPRIGYKGREFNIVKFRTMYRTAERSQSPAERADARVFKAGGWLRRFSLDELPQLINVLRGDMSLVGPRPHMVGQQVDGREFAEAVDEYAGRHWVKPGMTGWAQVNGWRGPAVTLEQIERRVEHDIYYIENWSLTFDLIILAKTIFVGFIGKNVF
jgi:Undecaprenyl-phosphate glucose phosphotransferase